MKVAILGLGYVGTVTAACLADNGHDVWGVDVDPVKVAAVAGGSSPVVEPGIDNLVRQGVDQGHLHATSDVAEAIAGADVSLVCVGTPSDTSGSTNLSYLESAVQQIASAMAITAPPASGRHTLVVRSTVPPGTVDGLVADILRAGAGSATGWTVRTAMCPEFLREGSGIADFFGPPFVVVGTADPDAEAQLRDLFAFIKVPVRVLPTREAETLKYACNAFHATKVTFANEIGRLFRVLDVDARDVMRVFCEDHELNISPRYLRPGFAFGGSCLPKDLRWMLHLARMSGTDLPMLAGVLESNSVAVRSLVDRILAAEGRRVAMFGLSFKMNTDDLRESPYVETAEILIGKGYDVRIFDPIINPAGLIGTNRRYIESRLPHLGRVLRTTAAEALDGADIALVACSSPEVVAAVTANPPGTVIDLVGNLDSDVEALAGYAGVAW